MNKEKFYLENMFNGYVENMPSWLKEEAERELEIIQFYVNDIIIKKGKNLRVLDIGCGDCRIYKNIKFPKGTQKIACDIFKYKDLPVNFKKWLKKNNIKYQQIMRNCIAYYMIPEKWGKFDIIIGFGIDSIIDDFQLFSYFKGMADILESEGSMIWQSQKRNTLKGFLLYLKDFFLKYRYRDIKQYKNLIRDLYVIEWDIQTKISHIYEFKKVNHVK